MKIPTEHIEYAEEEDALTLKHFGVTLRHHMTAIDRIVNNTLYNRIYHRGEDGRLEAANNWNRSKNL